MFNYTTNATLAASNGNYALYTPANMALTFYGDVADTVVFFVTGFSGSNTDLRSFFLNGVTPESGRSLTLVVQKPTTGTATFRLNFSGTPNIVCDSTETIGSRGQEFTYTDNSWYCTKRRMLKEEVSAHA